MSASRRRKHKKFLIKPEHLKAALKDYSNRNALIERLDLTPDADKRKLAKLALIFWLGSNIRWKC